MSVEYTTAIGFGIVISEKIAEEIFKKIEDRFGDEVDIFRDSYCRQIDQWCGGDYFLGFTRDLGDASAIPFDRLAIYGHFEFNDLVSHWDIVDIVSSEPLPRDYIITFCY